MTIQVKRVPVSSMGLALGVATQQAPHLDQRAAYYRNYLGKRLGIDKKQITVVGADLLAYVDLKAKEVYLLCMSMEHLWVVDAQDATTEAFSILKRYRSLYA